MGGSAILSDDWEFANNEARIVVLIGRAGDGKSSSGNSILGRKVFRSMPQSAGVTSTCEVQRTQLPNGQILDVIDRPEIVGNEVVKCIDLAKDGIHAVLLVLSSYAVPASWLGQWVPSGISRARGRRYLLSVSAALAPEGALSGLVSGWRLGFFRCWPAAKVREEVVTATLHKRKMTNESQIQDAVMTVAATSIASTSRANAPQPMAPAEKRRKFMGIDFKRWQRKMFFYLTTLRFQDSKSVVSQVQELQVIIHDLLAEVAAIIEKLPPMWKDFKNYLKHKRKEMTVEDLIVRLSIEEDNKAAERRSKGNSTINGAHIVEDDQNNSKKRKKVEQGSHQSKKKFKGKCFNCGKIVHKSMDYRAPKKGKKKDQAIMIKSNKECDYLCAMFSECNLVGNPREWWMDSGATRYVCSNKELFSSFAPAQVEEMIYMANSATVKVEGTGKVGLKMTSGKVLTLNNVLYVP
ncbi:Protein AIG1 [Capsicum baccatum]|uniref:Protein AIG1 n=1 Tax=Capsicum baccatum TaxID=33114 RepID=A0A2G2XST2_CAPBA|nr:Protein AIG1 [Capsicum baccatum]